MCYSNRPTNFSGSKEIAFTYAVASAGVVHAVTRACKAGLIENCGCIEKPRPKSLHPDWVSSVAYNIHIALYFPMLP